MQPSITDHAHPIDGGCPLVTGRGSKKSPACAAGGYPRTTAEKGAHGKDYVRTPNTAANEARGNAGQSRDRVGVQASAEVVVYRSLIAAGGAVLLATCCSFEYAGGAYCCSAIPDMEAV
jgi:hypothetical protein